MVCTHEPDRRNRHDAPCGAPRDDPGVAASGGVSYDHFASGSNVKSVLVCWSHYFPLTVTAVMVALCIIVGVTSRSAGIKIEFIVRLQLPTRVEAITDNAYVVFQAIVLASAVALLGFHWWSAGARDANQWFQISHLKTMRLLLRVQKVLCGIPALNFFKYLPTRGCESGQRVVSSRALLCRDVRDQRELVEQR